MEIRRLPVEDIKSFIELVSRSYPGMKVRTEDEIQKMADRFIELQESDKTTALYGAYQSEKLVGGMRLHDFEMTFYDQAVPVGGIGMVAVDLLHKKERIAKRLLEYFHNHYLMQGTYMTALYPFRPDFYRKMGYGYGAKKNRFRVKPMHLPKGGSKSHLSYLTVEHADDLTAYYNKTASHTHGLFLRTPSDFERSMKQPGHIMVGFIENEEIRGYAGFSFHAEPEDSFLQNDIIVHEIMYENDTVLSELLTFFHSQQDQVRSIYFDTQDEHFHHLLENPSNGTEQLIPHVFHESNTQGVGVMYRLLDAKKFLEKVSEHDFNRMTLSLDINLTDTFQPTNHKKFQMNVVEGHLTTKIVSGKTTEISLDVSDFTSMLMGVVPFDALHTYGRATISDKGDVDTVTKLFHTHKKPICMTRF
ncbi:enhanced intracellular survival protein Eis [Pseudalkalibacillus sp. SCS-8]|uniref:GNAT family N-acetyltransferase n=1 Tax=Pseudalkalibacillus nanhaiensis TaxID=3115291 RepID=UPI0032DA0143